MPPEKTCINFRIQNLSGGNFLNFWQIYETLFCLTYFDVSWCIFYYDYWFARDGFPYWKPQNKVSYLRVWRSVASSLLVIVVCCLSQLIGRVFQGNVLVGAIIWTLFWYYRIKTVDFCLTTNTHRVLKNIPTSGSNMGLLYFTSMNP